MKYLTPQDILIIHARLIDELGGRQGIRSLNLLLSLVESPKTRLMNKEMYKNIFQKAGRYLDSTLNYNVFVEGNKRIALALSARFLFLNGYEFSASNKETEKFVLKVVQKKMETKEIAGWFKRNSGKIR